METDGALVEWSMHGRPDAFVEVVQRHEVAVHGFLARRARPDLADDLLGEVWLRAFAARSGYDPAHADALPWLYGIARNVLREYWRAGLHEAKAPAPDVVDPWDEATPGSTLPPGPGHWRQRCARCRPVNARCYCSWRGSSSLRLRRPTCWASRRVPRGVGCTGREQRCAWLLGRRPHARRTRTT